MSSSPYLLVLSDREALGWVLSEERMAFTAPGRIGVRDLEVGDELFLYTGRGAFKNPTRDRGRVIGLAEVVTPVVSLETPMVFSEREFPVGCELNSELAPFGEGVELAPMISDLDAFRQDGRAWAVRFAPAARATVIRRRAPPPYPR